MVAGCVVVVVIAIVVTLVVSSSGGDKNEAKPVDPRVTATINNNTPYKDLPDPCAFPADVLTKAGFEPSTVSPAGVGKSAVALCTWLAPSDTAPSQQTGLGTVISNYTYDSWLKSNHDTIVKHYVLPDGRRATKSYTGVADHPVDQCGITWGTAYGRAALTVTNTSIMTTVDLCARIDQLFDQLYPYFRK